MTDEETLTINCPICKSLELLNISDVDHRLYLCNECGCHFGIQFKIKRKDIKPVICECCIESDPNSLYCYEFETVMYHSSIHCWAFKCVKNLTWIHCNRCGNPIMHMHDPYISSKKKRKEYEEAMKLLKTRAICRCCANPLERNCEECKVREECKIEDKK